MTPAPPVNAAARPRPEASIIMPVHNGARLLAESIGSAATQLSASLEIIVIDDASTDDTVQVAQSLLRLHQGAFTRTRLLQHQTRTGPAGARDTGMRAMTAEAALLLDADNLIYPNCARRCLDALGTSGAAFVYPILRVFGTAQSLLSYAPYNADLLARRNYIDNLALVRRSVWQAVGGFPHDADGLEDYAFWLTLLERGYHGAQVPEILGAYRARHNSRTQTALHRMDQINRRLEQRFPWLRRP